MRTPYSAERSAESRRQSLMPRLALVALPILGFTAGLPEYIEFRGVSLHLVVAVVLASLGWLSGLSGPILGRYLRWSILLAVWMCTSALAAWDYGTMSRSLIASAWLVVIAPGIANLLRDGSRRRALLGGMIVASLYYSITAMSRRAMGRSMFDLPDPSRSLLLGEKRGFVTSRLLFVLPFLATNLSPILKRARWLMLGVMVATLVLSGGRAALLALVVAALTLLLLQPGTGRRVRAIAAGLLASLALLMILDQVGGEAVIGRNRLLSFIRGERTTSDEIRELQLKRAWRVGWEHPAFGVGFNNLSGLDHPALDDARNSTLRGRAQSFGVHNTYAQMFGEFGIPGSVLFLGLLGSILLACIRKRGDPEVRAATSGYAAVLLMMLLNPMSLPFVYVTLAYLVGLLEESSGSDSPKIHALSEAGGPKT